jgi:hypothetical protein
MTAIFIVPQFIKALNNSRSNRIQMNIPDQFPEIAFFLTYNRFIAVLKQLAATIMSVVKSNDISGEKSSHEFGQRGCSATKKKVGMIGQKRPGITVCLGLGTEIFKPFNTVLTIFIVAKYFPAFHPSNHYVVQNAGSI